MTARRTVSESSPARPRPSSASLTTAIGVHLPHDVLRRATRVPRQATLRHAMLRDS